MRNRHLYPKNWEKLRVLIKIRDEFRCTICGKKESELKDKNGRNVSLHVMHIDGNTFNNVYTTDANIFNNPNNNLASGCPSCHRLLDQRNGSNKNYRVKQNFQVIDLSMSQTKK